MIKTKLENHKSAQCHVVITRESTQFWSYDTMVIEVNSNNNTLICTGLYSMTTRKQIGWFLNEYLPHISYYDIKKAVEKNGGIYQW